MSSSFESLGEIFSSSNVSRFSVECWCVFYFLNVSVSNCGIHTDRNSAENCNPIVCAHFHIKGTPEWKLPNWFYETWRGLQRYFVIFETNKDPKSVLQIIKTFYSRKWDLWAYGKSLLFSEKWEFFLLKFYDCHALMGSVSWWFKWQSVRDGEAPTLPALEVFFGALSYSNTLTCSVWWLQGGGDCSTWQILVLHVWPASLKRKERKFKNHLCWKINLFNKQKWNQFSAKVETWDCEDEWNSPEATVLSNTISTQERHPAFPHQGSEEKHALSPRPSFGIIP